MTPPKPVCQVSLMPDTQSLRDSEGRRVRLYCRACGYDCWHETGFVPVSSILPSRTAKYTWDTDARTCVDCPTVLPRGTHNKRLRCGPCAERHRRLEDMRRHCFACEQASLGACAYHLGLSRGQKIRKQQKKKRLERVAALAMA